MKNLFIRQVSAMPRCMIYVALVSAIFMLCATANPAFASEGINEYCDGFIQDIIKMNDLKPSQKTINKAWGLCTKFEESEAKKVLLKSPRRNPDPVVRDHRTPKQADKSPYRVCSDLVQGKIAWNYKGNKKWNKGNVQRLCRGTSNGSQPAQCFKRVMHGGIDWGGGTRWKWQNAIDLCEGTNSASRTIRCFERKISGGTRWKSAIGACQTR